ncbi:MAG: hypothetical protein COV71_00875 [Candidatus Omnitrophica bacterium CG11_big_fil_rev_8_21_14_0_20_41_12]|nr:MAG: hypothetical protein COV71_00875 [Candidatus Omnitrophica bacterium CG11_big_fil_rev_8_21_14_0_20_41_12]
MDSDDKVMMTKNNFDLTFWVLIALIGVMLFCAFLILKPKFTNKNNNFIKDTEINNQISIESRGLPGFKPNQTDDSMKINFHTPDGMFEDIEQARKDGVYKIYRSADSRVVDPRSVIAVSFAKKNNKKVDLNDFILMNTKNLQRMFPNQNMIVGIVHLEKNITGKFDSFAIPYQTMAFYIDRGLNREGYNCAVFFFETPDGFWSINWVAPRHILNDENSKERGIFLGMIKYMSIMIADKNSKDLVVIL